MYHLKNTILIFVTVCICVASVVSKRQATPNVISQNNDDQSVKQDKDQNILVTDSQNISGVIQQKNNQHNKSLEEQKILEGIKDIEVMLEVIENGTSTNSHRPILRPFVTSGHNDPNSSKHINETPKNGNFTNDHGNSSHPLVPQEHNHNKSSEAKKIHLANWKWGEYGKILTIALTLIVAGILKLGFHHTPVLPNYIPESCVLIIIGICMGAIIYARKELGIEKTGEDEEYFPRFTSQIFFLVLLPPIILDSAYSMYDRQFLDNLGGVLLFAVVGTLFNAFLIGYGLYLTQYLGFMGDFPPDTNMTTIDFLKFASLIAATDPVAVLAIFQEIGVNINLYFMVFGESLLNDGISVVVYNSMVSLGQIEQESGNEPVDKINYLFAFFSFFTVVFGGMMIGMCMALLTSLIVKFTEPLQAIEPFLIILMAYVSYVLADTVDWSGIISLITCGVTQKRYAFLNISKSSLTTVKNSVKTIATFSDVIIFLFLGIVTISHHDLVWHWGFSLWSVFWIQIIRFIGVFSLTFILNRRLLKKISTKEQFIMSYGGLRGAVGFSLAIILSQTEPGIKTRIILTTTLFIVYFTVFLQGGTIKFLVNKLKIDKQEEKVKMISDDVNLKTIDLVVSGVGGIVGEMTYSGVLEAIQSFDEKFVKKWLLRDNVQDKMTEKLNKISLNEHFARLYGPTVLAHQKKVHCVLKSIVPDVEFLAMSQSNGNISPSNSNSLHQNKAPKNSEAKITRPKNIKNSNVQLDKAILQRAFSGSAFEQSKQAEYSRMTAGGLSNSYDDLNDPYGYLMRDKSQKTKLIWQSAFSQVALQRRRRDSSFTNDNDGHSHTIGNKVENLADNPNLFNDDRKHMKDVYEKAKNEFKTSEMGNFGRFNSETRRHIQRETNNKGKNEYEGFNMSSKIGTPPQNLTTHL